jgi:PEP-CTERM motif
VVFVVIIRKDGIMTLRRSALLILGLACVMVLASRSAAASTVVYSNLLVTGQMAAVSNPDVPGKIENEAADDFVLASPTAITSASFIGLLPIGSSLTSLAIEFYRVFPLDSTNPPDGHVPTRANSPSDTAFAELSLGSGISALTTTLLNPTFTASNSVQAGGIHPSPGQTTGGNGPVTGQEIRFDVTFSSPLLLPADHYFFVPQVDVAGTDHFYWLSALRPIVAPGTPFSPDLQAWIRDGLLDPDWLRIGTDIVGGTSAPTFNMAFELRSDDATAAPEPTTMLLLGTGVVGLIRQRRQSVSETGSISWTP